jgi:phosphoserine phosphatase
MNRQREQIKDFEGGLIAFDFDGTLTTAEYRSSWQAVHEYFNTWASHGKIALEEFLEGKISYYEFCVADAYPWISRSEEEYRKALATIKLRKGLSELIDFLKEKGCFLAIISMGLGDIVEKVAKKYQFNFWIANELVRKNGIITGEVKVNVDLNEKGKILLSLLDKHRIPIRKSIAIGDASADIELFKTAGTSIVIEPSSERVASYADFICQTKNLKEIISFFDKK